MPLDQGAIDAACAGFPMKLSREEQQVAIRRMLSERKYTADLIAYYVGCTARQVWRLMQESAA